MKRLSIALALCAAALAESGITPPRLGYYRDPEGVLRPLYGVAGSFVPGQAALRGVLSAACSGTAVLVKTAQTVEWRDMELRLVERWTAPGGPARFVFTGARSAVARFLQTGETVRYVLRQVPRLEPDSQPRATPEELLVASPVLERIGEEWWAVNGRLAVRMRGGRASVYRIPEAAGSSPLELATLPDKTVYAPGAVIDLGTAAVGERRTFGFRVTNTGVAPIRLERIEAAGVGFLILDPPGLPATLPSRNWVEFHVEFGPLAEGGYNATLWVNGDSYLLVGKAVEAAAAVSLELDGHALQEGASVEFAAAGAREFVLVNHGDQAATVQRVTVSGTGFRGPAGLAPLTLQAGEHRSFDVVFEPVAAPCCEGTLAVDGLTVNLHGTAVNPAIPKFRIAIEPAALASGQQATLALKFDAPSPVEASGLVRMDFVGKGDPGRRFLTGDPKQAPFTIRAGEDTARFGEETSIGFQTGTTEGTILFTATLGLESEEASVQILPAPVGVDSVRLTRGPSSVTVALTGFDNTRSAGQATFTFHDASGAAIGSRIDADATAAFADYFQNAEMGGAFVLRALFPVTGPVTTIGSVDVSLTNSAGACQGHGKMAE